MSGKNQPYKNRCWEKVNLTKIDVWKNSPLRFPYKFRSCPYVFHINFRLGTGHPDPLRRAPGPDRVATGFRRPLWESLSTRIWQLADFSPLGGRPRIAHGISPVPRSEGSQSIIYVTSRGHGAPKLLHT